MLYMPVLLRLNKSGTLGSRFWFNREKLPSSIPSLHKPQISSLPYVVGQRFHLLVCGRRTRKTLPVTFTFLSRQGVEWQFIPKRAPWYGLFWECLIGLSKRAIKKTLGRAFITLESILNDNPITYVSGDVGDEEAWTPSLLLYGRRITPLPYPEIEDEVTDPTFGDDSDLKQRANTQELILQRCLVSMETRVSHIPTWIP